MTGGGPGGPAPVVGSLELVPAAGALDLLAPPVAAVVADAPWREAAWVVAIDPDLADTAALVAGAGVPEEASANCVVVSGRRREEERTAACVVLADSRADVNRAVRRRLDARRCSFAPHAATVAATGMEHGGITPVGLPAGWPVLVDERVLAQEWVVLGSGLRRSKLVLPGGVLGALSGAEVGAWAVPRG